MTRASKADFYRYVVIRKYLSSRAVRPLPLKKEAFYEEQCREWVNVDVHNHVSALMPMALTARLPRMDLFQVICKTKDSHVLDCSQVQPCQAINKAIKRPQFVLLADESRRIWGTAANQNMADFGILSWCPIVLFGHTQGHAVLRGTQMEHSCHNAIQSNILKLILPERVRTMKSQIMTLTLEGSVMFATENAKLKHAEVRCRPSLHDQWGILYHSSS